MPTHKPSELPPIIELAARVRAGETLRALAAEYKVALVTLQNRFNYAGFTPTGETKNEAQARERRTALAEAVRSYLEPWMEGAVCAQTDPEAFFPEKGSSTADAKRVCGGCDVRGRCLQYALERGEHFGVWGGKSERERRKLKAAA